MSSDGKEKLRCLKYSTRVSLRFLQLYCLLVVSSQIGCSVSGSSVPSGTSVSASGASVPSEGGGSGASVVVVEGGATLSDVALLGL